MTTIYGGQIPARPNPWAQFGLGMGEGWKEEEERIQLMKQQALGATIKMYQLASPEDRALMAKSPGWPNAIKMMKEFGIPVITMPDGHVGPPVPEATAEQVASREAAKFPGQTLNFAGQQGWDPSQPTLQLPAGPAGYSARQKALEAEVTGERAYRGALTGKVLQETSLLPQEMEISRRKAKLGEDALQVERDKLISETNKWKDYHRILRETLASKEGLAGLKEGKSDKEKRWDASYTDFNKRVDRLKTELRTSDALKPVDKVRALDQMLGDYAALRQTLPSDHPNLIAATVDVASVLAYEASSGDYQRGTELDKTRLQNILDTLLAALRTPGFPEDRGLAILQLLSSAGFQVDEKTGRILPPAEKGWLDSFLPGG